MASDEDRERPHSAGAGPRRGIEVRTRRRGSRNQEVTRRDEEVARGSEESGRGRWRQLRFTVGRVRDTGDRPGAVTVAGHRVYVAYIFITTLESLATTVYSHQILCSEKYREHGSRGNILRLHDTIMIQVSESINMGYSDHSSAAERKPRLHLLFGGTQLPGLLLFCPRMR